jgi:hypothetical protein
VLVVELQFKVVLILVFVLSKGEAEADARTISCAAILRVLDVLINLRLAVESPEVEVSQILVKASQGPEHLLEPERVFVISHVQVKGFHNACIVQLVEAPSHQR